MSLAVNLLKSPFALKKPSPKPEGVLLRAALFSDTHITKAMYRRSLLIPALKKLGRFAPDLVVFAGDCTDNGSEPNWRAFAADVKKYCKIENVIVAIGNHDTWESYACPHDYPAARERWLRFAGEIMGKRPENVWFLKVYNGTPFFILGSEDTCVGATLGEAQLSWLENALNEAEKARPGGPFVVVCHSPMNRTHGVGENERGMGLEGDASPRLQAILNAHENVFYLCGHTHVGLQHGGERATIQRAGKTVTSVCLPCFEYGEVFNGRYATSGYPAIGTGLLMDVYGDRVTFTGAGFLRGKEIPSFTHTAALKNENVKKNEKKM